MPCVHGTVFFEAMVEEKSTSPTPKVIGKVFGFSSKDLHICYNTILYYIFVGVFDFFEVKVISISFIID